MLSVPQTFSFGTKAETLWNLRGLVTEALVPDLYFFNIANWLSDKTVVLDAIQKQFGITSLAVRSSAVVEDSAESSMAGAFLSKLDVASENREELSTAIDQVVQSMTDNSKDQVLIQPMVRHIMVSGVIMTFDIVHGAPYYCIDYDDETTRTDVVTSGSGVHKSLFVYRDVNTQMIRSSRIVQMLRLAKELESICQCAALDIEFGLDDKGQMFLLQVRRIVLARHWHPVTERRVKRQLNHVENFLHHYSMQKDGVLGRRTILAIMPDWNPAEIIGTTPRPMAASLYRELITKSVWCHARSSMGYRSIGDAELMVIINNHPYIDVRNSFNSFLPANLPDATGEKLVDAWLNRLESFPEFHDKVEFEVVPTCLDFCFAEDFGSRYPSLLKAEEFNDFQGALRYLTLRCLTPGPDNSLKHAMENVARLERLRLRSSVEFSGYAYLDRAAYLLSKCRELGTFSFAVAARHAFIAEALLRSAVRRGAFTEKRLSEFKRSIKTVTGGMLEEYASVCDGSLAREEFLKKYGHLRPGTYEITSLRYDERDDLFLEKIEASTTIRKTNFDMTPVEINSLNSLLKETGLDALKAEAIIDHAKQAIFAREYLKFVFTRSLSDALSDIVRWGEYYGLSRDDLSFLEWPELAKGLTHPVMDDVDRYYLDSAEKARRHMAAAHAFRIGHIVYGVRDIYVATQNRSIPNFIGIGIASGKVVVLQPNTPTTINLKNRIICIENADPGFDWIFTKGIAALVTRFGGANSHMAVRCAEFGLPAAIGCGDQAYERVKKAGNIELNCAEKTLRPLYGE